MRLCYSRAMQNKAVSYFAAGHRPQHEGRRMVFHACSRAVAFILHAALNEIADNSIAPLLVEMQEKLCGLRLAAKYELALRGIIMALGMAGRSSICEKLQRLEGFGFITDLLPPISAHPVHMAGTSDGLAHLDAVAQSFYYAARDPHSGAFLTAKPCGTTELKNAEFRVALQIRLGAEQLPSGHRCSTHKCKIDPEASHALSFQN